MESDQNKAVDFLTLAFNYCWASSNLIDNAIKSNSPTDARSALFILRHSIELLLKSLHHLNNKGPWGHDLLDLNTDAMKILKGKVPTKVFEDVAKELGTKSEEVYVTVVRSWETQISILSEKYSKHLYLKQFNKLDKKNELLRYPQSPDFEDSFSKLDMTDLNKIKEDCEKVFEIIISLLFGFSNILKPVAQ